MSDQKPKKKIIRITQLQTVQLGEWLKANKDIIEERKWTVPDAHKSALAMLEFDMSRETVRDLGKAMGIKFHVAKKINTEPANESNKLRRELDNLHEKVLGFMDNIGNDFNDLKANHTTLKGETQGNIGRLFGMVNAMAERIRKLEESK